MARSAKTVISAADYPAIAQMCPSLPETLGAWEWNRDLASRDYAASGHEMVPIEITAEELRNYCARHGCEPNETAMRLLTEEKLAALDREE